MSLSWSRTYPFTLTCPLLSHAIGLGTGKPEDGAYQHYATVPEILTAPIPDSLPYANASVLPLAISTASAALFQKSHLGLDAPTMSHKSTGKTILVWGGSSSVGSTAIQLASAAGVTVATTASSHNHDYVKSMGAMHVFDHTKSSVVDDIVSALKGSTFAGAFDAISEEKTIKSSAEVASQLGGGVVATTLPPPETGLPENVEAKGVFAITIGTQQKEVGDAIWRKFVPEALAQGKLQAKPDPMVIKGGLSAVQEGLDKQKAGVSAKKVVVEIQEVGS